MAKENATSNRTIGKDGSTDVDEGPVPSVIVNKEVNKSDAPVLVLSNEDGLQKNKKAKASCCRAWTSTMFGTRAMVSEYDREDYIRVTLIEMIIYLNYLVVACIIAYGLIAGSTFYFTNAMYRLFLDAPFDPSKPTKTTFRTSATIEDFWDFAEKVMPNGLHWENWYGIQGDALPENDRALLNENRLLGLPRLRQIRVHDQKCPTSQKFNRHFRNCYPPYHSSYEEKGNYHENLGTTRSAWRYHSEEELEGKSHWGRLATYSGGGAYQILGTTKDQTIQYVTHLKSNRWINSATRVVFLDFTVFNANLNLFCIVKLVWEFPVTGGVVTSYSIRSVTLDRYATFYDYFILAMEIIFILFTIYYTIQEVMEMCLSNCTKYWNEFWTILDISILTISYICIAFGFYRFFLVLNTLEELVEKNSNKYSNFYSVGFWESQFNNCVAVLLFLIWVKIFKYISFNKTMNQLSNTMSRCSRDVGGFAIMFFIVFFAFAQLGYLLFGSTVEDFQTFHDTAFTLFRLILGDFDFRAIEAANQFLGPIYFITYVFFVFFVLLNMFLAIINETYSEVKAQVRAHGEEFQMSDYFKRCMNDLLCKSKRVEAEGKAKLATTENVITQKEIRENLTNSNYTDMEVEAFMSRNQLDVDKPLDVDDVENVLVGLEGRHTVKGKQGIGGDVAAADEAKRPTLTETEISELQSRVGGLESLLSSVTRKMDTLMGKLNGIDNDSKGASTAGKYSGSMQF